ncbi:SET domain-containing protein-lysine N-methyltransferase [Paraburkholderia franconis]|uniref:SET domain-containing protein-lysine N-methyltransferase n=1 Tax=Paraburkholderia franconis TaxID=2654983 RepID=UPI002AB1DF80|nr:SET domain-containing protein-lysine N-methyltransferase [Paraburkholderia franconis]
MQPSPVHGQGVFANQDIGRAELIAEYKGARVPWQHVVQRASSYGKTPGHTFLFDIGDGTVIDGARGGSSVRWMNHGCEPNCKAYIFDGRVFIYALGDVKRGEELTINYGLVVDGPQTVELRELYRCQCGSPNCRGTMLAETSRSKQVGSDTSSGLKPPEIRVLERPSATTIIVSWCEAGRCHYGEQVWILKKAVRDGYCALSYVPVKAGDRVFVPRGTPPPLNHDACISQNAVPGLPIG